MLATYRSTFPISLSQMMEAEPLSAGESRRSSRSHGTLLVTLRLPPRSLQLALNPDISLPISALTVDAKSAAAVAASPFPLVSSPPTIASSPAPTGPLPPKKRGGKRKAVGPGAGVFSLAQTAAENGGGSGAGTPAPTTEKEKVKSGPKANPGGINAQLRALDRTGRPTRKWTKVPFPVKTCSGYTFYSTTWVTPATDDRIYEKMRVDVPNANAAVNDRNVKTEIDKPLGHDAMIALPNAVGA